MRPEIFRVTRREGEVGPLQALIDELEFNSIVASKHDQDDFCCPFATEQFGLAIQNGQIALLKKPLKQAILEAYEVMRRANQLIQAASSISWKSSAWYEAAGQAMEAIKAATDRIRDATRELMKFLTSDNDRSEAS